VTAEDLGAFAPVVVRAGGGGVPGSLKSHYAPRTPLRLAGPSGETAPPGGGRCGLLAWSRPRPGFASVQILSATGDPREAAANFFAALRALDAGSLDLILAENPPPGGLGDAIRERLQKAAAAGRDNAGAFG
jgi:L-threonylcarbamoyladenylate synthase